MLAIIALESRATRPDASVLGNMAGLLRIGSTRGGAELVAVSFACCVRDASSARSAGSLCLPLLGTCREVVGEPLVPLSSFFG